jgi:hypothetical protein
VVPSKPILLSADEFRIDDTAVTRHVGGVRSADRKQPVKRVRPRRHIGVGIDRGVAGFLDEITTEDHEPLAVITRHHYDEIRVSVAASQMSDRHVKVTEVDDRVVNGMLRRPKGRDRAVDLIDVGTVTQGVVRSCPVAVVR